MIWKGLGAVAAGLLFIAMGWWFGLTENGKAAAREDGKWGGWPVFVLYAPLGVLGVVGGIRILWIALT